MDCAAKRSCTKKILNVQKRDFKSRNPERSGLRFELRDPRPLSQNFNKIISRWENLIIFSIALSLPTNKYIPLKVEKF